MTKFTILALLILTIDTAIHDSVHRGLIDDDDDSDEKRIWCIVTYPPNVQFFNLAVHIFRFFAPFIINLISALVIIQKNARHQATCQPHKAYQNLLRYQFQQHNHLLIAPVMLVILAFPRLIISFLSGCMKSTRDSWLFLVGYFISFILPMLLFVVFVLSSNLYKEEFHKCIGRYRKTIQRRVHLML
ncbi:unnamed protein product [Rotaria magnacalcarata]|uniref:G-protein coupled receptors family 1 profile domain-containing protein n=1 Tax=Rotaria magnacalcarata TaxID=392030 RepID=A0A815E588_9BILA|nr:unnamed protein product [Rotaria magnacalcarata]CAF4553903.1 unnamed protein product [Rotaria magnacalcarata]